MRKRLWYPKTTDIIAMNKLMVNKFRATKAEQHKVISRRHIDQVLKSVKRLKGSPQEKAVELVTKLQYHPFASANRRTAYYAMNEFLWRNEGYCLAKKKRAGKDFMRKIRRGELTNSQIREIIKK